MELRYELPKGPFGTIYADPPWPHDDNQNSRRRLHYDRMELDEIMNIPVGMVCHPDAHLHLWTTTTHLEVAFQVIKAWGFDYKTTAVWRKTKLGMGWWLRSRHEFLIFAARSKNARGNPGSLTTELEGKWRGHSVKPVEAYERIEQSSPGPYLELFSRDDSPRKGWTTLSSDAGLREPYNRVAALPESDRKRPVVRDLKVRGVGGLEIRKGTTYNYQVRVIENVPVLAVEQKGRNVIVEMPDGEKKRVSIDKLRPVTA